MFLYRTCIVLYLAACSLLLFPCVSYARQLSLSGRANLGYTNYDGTAAGLERELESFYQSYSLVARKNGNLYNRRGGPYSLALYYNHRQDRTVEDGVDYAPNYSFLGWHGDLALHMPHLYGFDLSMYSDRIGSPVLSESAGSGFAQKFVLDWSTQEVNKHGLDIKLGVNGGPYYYLYHNRFDRQVEDGLHDYFSRIGASMQYGVNWVHLYRDEGSPGGIEKQIFHMGNIGLPERTYSTGWADAYLASAPTARYWYRLTNWLKLSADLFHSDAKSDSGDVSKERATLALRGEAGRGSFSSYAFHERTRDDSYELKLTSLPLWWQYRISPATNLSFSNAYSTRQTEDLGSLVEIKESHLEDSLTLTSRPEDAFLETGYTLKKEDLEGEKKESHAVFLEAYRKREIGLDYGLSYQYDTAMKEDAAYSGKVSDSHFVSAIVSYRANRHNRIYLRQIYRHAYNKVTTPSERSEQYITSLDFSHTPSSGMQSNLELFRNYKSEGNGNEIYGNGINGRLSGTINSRLNLGADGSYNNAKSDNGDSSFMKLRMGAEYKAARQLLSNTELKFTKADQSAGSSSSEFEFRETLEYSYNERGFSGRRLLEVKGSVWHIQREVGDIDYDDSTLSLGVNYYPRPFISCGAYYATQNNNNIIDRELYAALRYPLMTLKASYNRRMNKSGDQKSGSYNIDFTKKF